MLPGLVGAIGGLQTAGMMGTLRRLGLTTNLKLCLDAGDGGSYGSGQKWNDLSGGGYDFFRGTDATSEASDPTFNGTAGGQSSSEYFSLGLGDYFTYDTSNETWMSALHKDSAILSAAAWVFLSSSAVHNGVFQTLGTGGSATGAALYVKSTSPALRFEVQNAGGTVLGFNSAASVSTGAWTFLGFSLDETTGAAAMQINSTSETFTGKTYSSPSAGASSGTMQVGAYGAGNLVGRIANTAVWQGTALSSTSLAAIFSATRAKFGV